MTVPERNPAMLRLKELEALKEIESAFPNPTLVMGPLYLLRSLGDLNKD